MKYLLLLFLLLIVTNAFSYDGKVKDKYGRVTGYFRVDDNKQITIVYDLYGRKLYTLEIDEKAVRKVEEKLISD